MNESIAIRNLKASDSAVISYAFDAQGWNKPESQFVGYFDEQNRKKRDVLLAEVSNEFAGYLTIIWNSCYPPFKEAKIPEIVDFNVLVKFQRKGVGAKLMDEAESRVSSVSDVVGIGVGLTSDYGSAQRLYVKRGYVPDGKGVSQNGRFLNFGERINVDDSLVIFFTKKLSITINTHQDTMVNVANAP